MISSISKLTRYRGKIPTIGGALANYPRHQSSHSSSTTNDDHLHPPEHEHEHEHEQPDPFLDPSLELVKQVADDIRHSVRKYTLHHKLKLIGIIASRSFTATASIVDQGADTYSEWIGKTCKEDGIEYETWRVAGGTESTATQVQNLVERANHLENAHGILVYYPLYNKPYVLGMTTTANAGHGHGYGYEYEHGHGQQWSIQQQQTNIENGCEEILIRNKAKLPGMTYKTKDDYFRDSISASRDVEGHNHNRRKFRNQNTYVDRCKHDDDLDSSKEQDQLLPCTALAVVRVLKRCLEAFDPRKPVGKRFEGVTVTIINRSEILGRPLASLLANDGATVYSVDADSIILYKPNGRMNRCTGDTKSVQSCVEESSVIVTGVPSSTFKIPSHWIQPYSTVINVASEPNVDEDELREIPGCRYIPQIGKVTVALLEHNLVQLHRRFHSKDDKQNGMLSSWFSLLRSRKG